MSLLKEMIQNLLSRPVTILYPREPVPIPDTFRGRVANTEEICIGCSKCAQVCPATVITMIEGPRDVEFRGKKIARKKRPEIDLYKCIRCGLCERHCPTGSIHLEHVHAGTGTDRDVRVT